MSTLDSLGNDIEKYVDEMQDKFIEGQIFLTNGMDMLKR